MEIERLQQSSLKVSHWLRVFENFEIRADFEVKPGDRMAVLARSGAGKTALLRWIAGFDEDANSGELFVGTENLTRVTPELRCFGVVFQEPALFESKTVLENITFGLMLRGMSRAEQIRIAHPWMLKLGLTEISSHRVENLSGGEKQRICFLRAMLWKPKALLLDEPFSAIDSQMRQKVRLELLQLLIEYPVPLIIVTHDEEDVRTIANRTLILEETEGGKIRTFREKIS